MLDRSNFSISMDFWIETPSKHGLGEIFACRVLFFLFLNWPEMGICTVRAPFARYFNTVTVCSTWSLCVLCQQRCKPVTTNPISLYISPGGGKYGSPARPCKITQCAPHPVVEKMWFRSCSRLYLQESLDVVDWEWLHMRYVSPKITFTSFFFSGVSVLSNYLWSAVSLPALTDRQDGKRQMGEKYHRFRSKRHPGIHKPLPSKAKHKHLHTIRRCNSLDQEFCPGKGPQKNVVHTFSTSLSLQPIHLLLGSTTVPLQNKFHPSWIWDTQPGEFTVVSLNVGTRYCSSCRSTTAEHQLPTPALSWFSFLLSAYTISIY